MKFFSGFFLALCLFTCLRSDAQPDETKQPIILFFNEPLPAGAKLISSSKVVSALSDFWMFKKSIVKKLTRAKGNLARINEYETPTTTHGHRAMVSFYSVENFTEVANDVEKRRDSIESAAIGTDTTGVRIYFFRFKISNKYAIKMDVEGQPSTKITQSSTYVVVERNRRSVGISGKVLGRNSFNLYLDKQKAYFVECSIGGGNYPIPVFHVVPTYIGRYMYDTIHLTEGN